MAVQNPPTMRCKKCGEVKPIGDFRKNAPSPNGHRQPCKPCLAVYNRAHYRANPEAHRTKAKRWHQKNYTTDLYMERHRPKRLQWRYGITDAQYAAMLAAQDGGCAVCGKTPEENGKFLAVDHDHSCCPGKKSCGKCVRGLLCQTHNRAIGLFNDDPKMLLRAVDYLERGGSK